jgi:hypothetical protein
MTRENVIQWFSSLPKSEQIGVISQIAHALIIAARETYVPQSNEIAKPFELRGCNELQHQLMGHLLKLIDNNTARYPDELFIQILFEMADLHQISSKLNNAIKHIQQQ